MSPPHAGHMLAPSDLSLPLAVRTDTRGIGLHRDHRRAQRLSAPLDQRGEEKRRRRIREDKVNEADVVVMQPIGSDD